MVMDFRLGINTSSQWSDRSNHCPQYWFICGTLDTDKDSMDSASAAGLSNSPPYFFLDGNQLAYYNLDDVPHEALEKLALASSFFLECKTVYDFLPYDLCPLKVALQ
jgi:hypothetical protein